MIISGPEAMIIMEKLVLGLTANEDALEVAILYNPIL
jgi:hypothetical protein